MLSGAKIEFGCSIFVFNNMYYHGTKRCDRAPYAHADKYTFWVYPINRKIGNKWDTNISATLYCNNHTNQEKIFDLLQYNCLGHTSIDDMKEAQDEWTKMGWDVNIEEKTAEVKEPELSINIIRDSYQEFIKSIKQYNDVYQFFTGNLEQDMNLCGLSITAVLRLGTGFMFMKFQEQQDKITKLEIETAKLRAEFKEVLTTLTIKKPVGQEIAELQTRIIELYAEKGKN